MQDTNVSFVNIREYITKNSFWIIFIDIIIVALTIAALLYVYLVNTDNDYKIIVGILLFLMVFYIIINRDSTKTHSENKIASITKLILLDAEGVSVKEWSLQGKTALLIGKSTKKSEVDIDLADTEYASLINKQHAVLNYAAGSWYIEDIGSMNEPHRIEHGDIIHIANTRLLVK